MKIRLAFDARAWEGPPRSCRSVLRILVDAARDAGWQVDLWTDGPLRPEFESFSRLARPWKEAVRTTEANALWSPDNRFFDAPIPVIATVHDINPLVLHDRPLPIRLWRAFRYRRIVNRVFERSFRVVTDTEDSRNRISSAFPAGAKRLRVVPLCIRGTILRASAEERGRRLAPLGLSEGYVLFVSSLRRHKNWEGLIRAYALLPPSLREEHALVFAGPARRAEGKALRLAAQLGIERQVRILGTVADDVLPALYSGAVVFVFPSFMEGFGLPPLEAMACGCPVVATNRTCVPEVLGDAPIYIDPADTAGIADAIRRVVEDKAKREEMVGRGLRRVCLFNSKRTATAMRRVLEELPFLPVDDAE